MKKLFKTLLSVVLAFAVTSPALAAYPEKPVNMVIAFTAGGSSDVQARIMQNTGTNTPRSLGFSFIKQVRAALSASRKSTNAKKTDTLSAV